jgi:hypothetical protein
MATFTIKVSSFLIIPFFHSLFFFHRTNCPKVSPSSNLLSDKDRQIWDQSEAIQDKDKELIEVISTRYGFTEV